MDINILNKLTILTEPGPGGYPQADSLSRAVGKTVILSMIKDGAREVRDAVGKVDHVLTPSQVQSASATFSKAYNAFTASREILETDEYGNRTFFDDEYCVDAVEMVGGPFLPLIKNLQGHLLEFARLERVKGYKVVFAPQEPNILARLPTPASADILSRREFKVLRRGLEALHESEQDVREKIDEILSTLI